MKRRKSRRHINPKRVLLLLVVVGLIGGAAYGANTLQVQRNATKMLNQARAAREKDNSNESLILYESYLNFQPKDADALGELASLLEGNTNPKAKRTMMDCYERMMIVAPTKSHERKKLAKLYMDNFLYSNARHHLYVLLDPSSGMVDDPELLNQLAVCEFRSGKTVEGMQILKRLIALRTADPEVYRRLAEMQRKESANTDSTAADQTIAQLLRDQPNNIEARVIAINELYRKGEVTHAREATRRAASEVRDHEKNPDFVLMVVDLYLHEKQYPPARELLQKAIERNPNDARLRTVAFQVYDRLNDQAKSEAELKKALDLAKSNDLTTVDLFDVMIERKQFDLARREMATRYVNKEQFRPILDYLESRILSAEGNWSAALPKLQEVMPYLERFPIQYSRAQVNLAECHVQANQPERAFEAYSKALLARPNYNVARLGRAEMLLRMNRVAEAEPTLREYAETFPFVRLAWVNAKLNEQLARPANRRNWTEFETSLGKPPYQVGVELLRAQALVAQEKPADAEKLLKELLSRKPESPEVRVSLAQFVSTRSTKEALDVLEDAERFVGDHIAFRTSRASLLARTSRDVNAIRALAEKSEKWKPEEQRLLRMHISMTLASLGDYPKAIEVMKPLPDQNKFDLGSRTQLAEWYLRTKQFAEAEAVVAEMKKLDGDHGSSSVFLRVLLTLHQTPKLSAEQANQLQSQLVEVTKKRETWPRPHAILGAISINRDDSESALKHYRRAYELGERDTEMFSQYANLLLARNRNDEARRILEDRERTVGLPDNLKRTLSLLNASLGVGGSANEEIVRKTESSTDPKEQLFRGQWFLLSNRKSEAVKALKLANQHGPHIPETWLSLVQSLMVNGEHAAAKETVTKIAPALAAAGDKLPNKSLIPLTVGQCQEMVGDAVAAEQTYLQALNSSASDPLVLPALADLYRRTGRVNDANTRCEAILQSSAPDAMKRWARRTLATNKMNSANRVTGLKEALALMDENAKSGEFPEDVRARAFLIAQDPFRRAEAHEMLDRTSGRDTMTPDDLYQLAQLYAQEDRLPKAESALQEAAKSPSVSPAILVFLNQIQIRMNRMDAARSTVDRLKNVAPQSWQAVSEEARLIAKQGDKQRAVKLAKAFPNAEKPEVQLQIIAPFLSTIGCLEEAEEMFKSIAQKSKLPNRHAALVFFYIENQMPMKALTAAWEPEGNEFTPQFPKALLMKNAVATRPRATVPPGELAEWDKIVTELLEALDDEIKANPKNLGMLASKAAVLDSHGKYDDAIRTYESILAIDDKQYLPLNNLAILISFHTKDRTERPLKLVNQAIELVGPRGYLLDTRATISLSQGKHEEATKDLLAARSVEPRAVYDFHLALAAHLAKNDELKRSYLAAAREKGLRKSMLHPLEWPDYERHYGRD